MIELISAAVSTGAGSPVSFPERAQLHTAVAVPSGDFSGSATLFVQAGPSTNGPWCNVTATMSLGSTGSCDIKNVANGTYVALRGYVDGTISAGSVSLQLFSDRA